MSALAAERVWANEGQWTPDQIADLDPEKLREMGLELSPTALWDPAGDERTGGLMRAAVNLGGCSAAFVSREGLVATNHHCAYGALQANSSVEHDYLADGFVARKRSDELPAPARPVRVLRKQSEVTDQIRPGADALGDDAQRARYIERRTKELVDACEARDPALRCELASFYNGKQYRLFEYFEIRDVRVVYAPPASVGEYGGEIDNWMWPRHTGDFALMRAYVGKDGKPADFAQDNVPYEPGQFLEVSTQGISPGDFVAILGYPGRTQRYLSAAEVQRNVDQVLPSTVDLYGEWISILEAEAQRDPAVKIKVAALKKSLANRHKNARGMLDGLEHMKLLESRRQEEAQLREWAKAEGREAYRGVLDELDALSAETRAGFARSTLLSATRRGPNSLAAAIDLVRYARAKKKPDIERPDGFRERDADRAWSRQARRLEDFDAQVDAELIASLLARAAMVDEEAGTPQLGELSKIAASKGGRPGERRGYLGRARSLVGETEVTDPEKLEALWKTATPETLARSQDPMIQLARSLVDETTADDAEVDRHTGARARLRPKYFEMLEAVRQGPIYPDANGTLRFSFASVRGYDKWDGETQSPQTVLAGAVAKHSGAEPFNLPAKVRQSAKSAKQTYWSDPDLGDLPLCFLSDGDTTGGNSGSPVIDGRGRLVGFNFDRVWENIAGDYAYNEGHSRNISADVRHLLWMLDKVDDAGPLLAELGVDEYRDAPARRKTPEPEPAATEAEAPPTPAPPTPPTDKGCNCSAQTGGLGFGSSFAALVWLSAMRRRRRR